MVETTLTDRMIESGAQLVRRLDESDMELNAAFWLYSSDLQAWKFVIAQAGLAELGPKKIYRRIQRVLRKFPDEMPEISLDDVVLSKPDAPIVSLLRRAVRSGADISGTRLRNVAINGTLVEGAYIYRLTRKSTDPAHHAAKE